MRRWVANAYLLNMILLLLINAVESSVNEGSGNKPHDRNRGFERAYTSSALIHTRKLFFRHQPLAATRRSAAGEAEKGIDVLGFSAALAISTMRAALLVLLLELKRAKPKPGVRLPAKAGVIGRRFGRTKRGAIAAV